jgi:hypothetical protein
MNDRTNDGGIRLAALAPMAALIAVLPLLHALAAPLAAEQLRAQPRADNLCDPGLESRSEDPRAYRVRDDRCEGIFRLKVNSDKIQVKSWTAWFEDYDYRDETPLRVSWSLPSRSLPSDDAPVHLRAYALRTETPYRMDTTLSGSQTPWTWPTGFLGQLRLGRRDLGIVGWTSHPAVGPQHRVYLPLEVRQNRTGRPDGYRVTLVPGERLRTVEWRIAPVGKDGNVGAPLGESRPLGFGFYPAGQPTVFTVPEPDEPGLYVLKIETELRSGQSANRDVFFHHPDSATNARGES